MESMYDILRQYAENDDTFFTKSNNRGYTTGMEAIRSKEADVSIPMKRAAPMVDAVDIQNRLKNLSKNREEVLIPSIQRNMPDAESFLSKNPKSKVKYYLGTGDTDNTASAPKKQEKITKAQSGGDVSALSSLGGLAGGDPYTLALQQGIKLTQNLGEAGKGIIEDQKTKTKHNKGENIGKGIGAVADAFNSLSPFAGLISYEEEFAKLGKMFDPKTPTTYTPSGNTTGNYSTFQKGGDSGEYFRSSVPYREGSNKKFAMDTNRLDHTLNLDEQYGFPFGTMAGLGLTEAKTFSRSKGVVNDDNAVSSAGAVGPYQFMPTTAEYLGVKNSKDFYESSKAAAKYLYDYQKRFGTLEHALGAYNVGGGNYNQYLMGKKSLPKETQEYAKKVGNNASRFLGYPLPQVVVAGSRM